MDKTIGWFDALSRNYFKNKEMEQKNHIQKSELIAKLKKNEECSNSFPCALCNLSYTLCGNTSFWDSP